MLPPVHPLIVMVPVTVPVTVVQVIFPVAADATPVPSASVSPAIGMSMAAEIMNIRRIYFPFMVVQRSDPNSPPPSNHIPAVEQLLESRGPLWDPGGDFGSAPVTQVILRIVQANFQPRWMRILPYQRAQRPFRGAVLPPGIDIITGQ